MSDVKLDKLMDMMETVMISVHNLNEKIDNMDARLSNVENDVTMIKLKIDNDLEPKIDLALEMVTKTSNYELEKRVTALERKPA